MSESTSDPKLEALEKSLTALVMRPAPATVDQIVYVPVPQPVGMSPAPTPSAVVWTSSPGALSSIGDTGNLWASSAEYLQQRNQAIRWGVEALPPAPSVAASMQTPTVESMLGLPERKTERAGQFHLKF